MEWNRGALLSSRPSLFTPVWNRYRRKYPSPQSLLNAWGIEALQLDEDAMQHQLLTLKQLSICLPDGTRIGTANTAALPCAVPLDQHLAQELQQVDVLLALPTNEHRPLQHHSRVQEPPALAYQAGSSGREACGRDVAMSAAIGLRFSADENRGYQTYPLPLRD